MAKPKPDVAPIIVPADRAATRRELVTPEGVDLDVQIGQASERAAAFVLDLVFMTLGLIAFSLLSFLVFAGVGAKGAAGEFVAGLWFLGSFALRNFYFVAFELTPRAATPGKRILGLRVAARDGGRLEANAVFARNALREIEVFLPLTFLLANAADASGWMMTAGLIWTGVFVFFPLFNRDRLRAGDLVAGTWVVKAPKRTLLEDLAGRAASHGARYSFTQAQLDAYGVKELHVLEDVLRRSNLATMTAVADRIRKKIDWTRRPDETDYSFLDAYYAALRRRLEGRLLFGHRRKDKFDKA